MSCKSVGGREAMQLFEDAETRACIGGHINDPDLLPGCEPLPILRHFVRKTDLTGGEEQQSPARRPPRRAVSRTARLARAIRQEVGHLSGLSCRDLSELIKTQKR